MVSRMRANVTTTDPENLGLWTWDPSQMLSMTPITKPAESLTWVDAWSLNYALCIPNGSPNDSEFAEKTLTSIEISL